MTKVTGMTNTETTRICTSTQVLTESLTVPSIYTVVKTTHSLLPNLFSQMNAFIMNSKVISAAKTLPTFLTLMCFFTCKGKIQ